MVKFIFEVDEEFINFNADIIKKQKEIENLPAQEGFKKLLMCLPYETINTAVKEGKTEFIINSDYIADEIKSNYKNTIDAIVLLTSTIALKNKNKESEEKSKENIDNINK